MRLCDDPSNPTQECFDRTPLEFISDESFLERAVKDANHPERGYLHPNNADAIPADEDWRRDQIPFGGGMNFKMTYRIPENVECEHCLLQWTYVTGNSCNSVGYSSYLFPSETWWRPFLSDCPNPPPRNGLVENIPEMFWNCADVRIASDCSASASPDTDTDVDLPIEEDQGQGESENSGNNDPGNAVDLQKERARHVRFFSSQCQDKIWEQSYVTGEPEVYTCADYASWGDCDEDWMEGWCDKTCGKCCQDHIWETNYNTQQPEVYICADYASWGSCGEDWMDGWCEATCGRCSQPADDGSGGDAGSGDGNGDMAGDGIGDSSGGDGADGSSDDPGTVEERLTALEEEVEAIRAQVEDMSNQLL